MTLSPLRFYTKKGPLRGSPSKTLLRTLRLSKVKLDCQSRERLGNPMDGVGVRRKEMVGGGDSRNTIRANCGTLQFSSTPSIPHPLPHPLPHPFPQPPSPPKKPARSTGCSLTSSSTAVKTCPLARWKGTNISVYFICKNTTLSAF